MTYALWNPISELDALLEAADRISERPFSTAGATPGVNVYADDEAAVITTELPGVAASDVQLQLNDGILTLAVERPDADRPQDALLAERRGLRFSRSVSLPFAVDPDAIEARLNDGILTVALKRAAADRPRRIQVSAN